jgi:hypothetical protein
MSASLPIRRLTLYKHGVAFVEREGNPETSQIVLRFRSDEVNDALKSLLVIERTGAGVRGIHYETPAKTGHSPLQISGDHSLLDLARGLRGRRVQLRLTDQTATGRLVGVDVEESLGHTVLVLLEESAEGSPGTIRSFALERLLALVLLDAPARADLHYFLDASLSDADHRAVTLALEERPTYDLLVSYLVPSAAWRVSYRLVAETETDEAGARRGSLLLQGWGLFDNRFEEDLDGVAVRLVAGQPISFVYDLAASEVPRRPTVKDEVRVAPGPVEFEESFVAGGLPAAPMVMMEAMLPAAPGSARRSARFERQALAEQTPSGTATAMGELFQYEVSAPVRVRRGESALVPIFVRTLPYRYELLYNGRKLPQHPVAAFRLTNDTGLVLERGPVTVIEDGEYRGEAVVPFTTEGAELYLAFAVELGIRVHEEATSDRETVGLEIAGRLVVFQEALVWTTTYRIENRLTEARTVTLEHPIRPATELVGEQPADAQTAEHYRWQIRCPAREKTRFTVRERRYERRSQQTLDLDYADLERFLEHRWLDEATLVAISDLLHAHQSIAHAEAEIEKIALERKDLFKRQEQWRQNLGILRGEGDEGTFRSRLFEQLVASEDRLAALDHREAELKAHIAQTRESVDAMLADLRST